MTIQNYVMHGVMKMLEKNIKKEKQKTRKNWIGLHTRIVKDKTKYTRKQKHKSFQLTFI